MKIVLTGAHGFIGSHIFNHFTSCGDSVYMVPRDDLYDTGKLEQYFRVIPNPDMIIHTAAYGNMAQHESADMTFTANVIVLYNLLSVTKSIPYSLFINFSTSSVLLEYETMYSATKGAGERIAKAYSLLYKKPIVTVRPFTVIGPGEQKEHLIPTLIRSGREQTSMQFYGQSVHDFIDVRDVMSALQTIIERKDDIPRIPVDIGTGQQRSNEDVLTIVENEIGQKIPMNRIDNKLRVYDTDSWRANIDLLTGYGWKPHYTLEQTVHDMVTSYAEQST